MPRAKPDQADFHKFEGEKYNAIAQATQAAVFTLLNDILAIELTRVGQIHGDGGPIVAGALGGIIEFATMGSISDEALREQIVGQFECILPQIRMAHAADMHAPGHA